MSSKTCSFSPHSLPLFPLSPSLPDKSIETVTEQCDHKVIDLFVLFILHSLPSRKKAVETLFISKVQKQLFTEELLAAAFGPHAKVYTIILDMAHVILHHNRH